MPQVKDPAPLHCGELIWGSPQSHWQAVVKVRLSVSPLIPTGKIVRACGVFRHDDTFTSAVKVTGVPRGIP